MSDLWLPAEARRAVWVPDAEQVVVIGWRPGPAGVSSLDVTATMRVTLDHASPTTLNDIVFEAPGGRISTADAGIAAALLGNDAVRQLMVVANVWRDRPLPLAGSVRWPYDDDLVHRFARLVLAADLADDADLPELVRALARLEAVRLAASGGIEAVLGRGLARLLVEDAAADLRAALDRGDAPSAATLERLVDGLDRHGNDWRTTLRTIDEALSTFDRFDDEPGSGLVAAGAPALPGRPGAPASPASFDAVAPIPAAATAAPPATPLALRRREAGERRDPDPIDVDSSGGGRAMAWIDEGGNVRVTGALSLVGSWARVFRRRGELLLGLSPLLPATASAGTEATVVIPSGHSPADLVVDVTDEPAAPRPSPALVQLREAIRRGRTAAHRSRVASADAAGAWSDCAAAWRDAGDHTRANLAGRYAAGDTRSRSSRDELELRRWRSARADALVADRWIGR